jgi:hypothetical protein
MRGLLHIIDGERFHTAAVTGRALARQEPEGTLKLKKKGTAKDGEVRGSAAERHSKAPEVLRLASLPWRGASYLRCDMKSPGNEKLRPGHRGGHKGSGGVRTGAAGRGAAAVESKQSFIKRKRDKRMPVNQREGKREMCSSVEQNWGGVVACGLDDECQRQGRHGHGRDAAPKRLRPVLVTCLNRATRVSTFAPHARHRGRPPIL